MRKTRSKRAVSPVLATLLMVAVAVSMSVIIFMWSQNFLSTTSEAAHRQQQAQNIAAQSQIAIENVRFYTTDGTKKIDVVVRNVGRVDVTLSNIYIDHAVQTVSWSSSTINPEAAATGTVTYTWSSGESYIIKVTTTVGTFAETVVIAP
jgi:flagellin-like protein